MTAHLKAKDTEIAVEIADFRAKAKNVVQSGQPLPPIPDKLRQLHSERTGLLVQHMVNLRKNLGPAASSALDR